MFFNPKTRQRPELLLWDHIYHALFMIHLQVKGALFNNCSNLLGIYCDATRFFTPADSHGCDVEADLCQGSGAIQHPGCCRGRLSYFGLMNQGNHWVSNG